MASSVSSPLVPRWVVATVAALVVGSVITGAILEGRVFWADLAGNVATWGLFTLLAGAGLAILERRSARRETARLAEPHRRQLETCIGNLTLLVPLHLGIRFEDGGEAKIEVLHRELCLASGLGPTGFAEDRPEADRLEARAWIARHLPLDPQPDPSAVEWLDQDTGTIRECCSNLEHLDSADLRQPLENIAKSAEGIRTMAPGARSALAGLAMSGETNANDEVLRASRVAVGQLSAALESLHVNGALLKMHLGAAPTPARRWSREWWLS